MAETTTEHVHWILDTLDAAGIEAWLGGGWGVDALVGRQTRPHVDLDVAIDALLVDATRRAMAAVGFATETDWLPVRVELVHPDGCRIDLHPVVFDDDGNGTQAGLDGATFGYPAADLTTGEIAGRTVRCISARLQMLFHTGYSPTDTDRRDVATLAAATGEAAPADYV